MQPLNTSNQTANESLSNRNFVNGNKYKQKQMPLSAQLITSSVSAAVQYERPRTSGQLTSNEVNKQTNKAGNKNRPKKLQSCTPDSRSFGG